MRAIVIALIGSLLLATAPLAAEAHETGKKVIVVKEVDRHSQPAYGKHDRGYYQNRGHHKGHTESCRVEQAPPRWGNKPVHQAPVVYVPNHYNGGIRISYGTVITPSGYGRIDVRLPW